MADNTLAIGTLQSAANLLSAANIALKVANASVGGMIPDVYVTNVQIALDTIQNTINSIPPTTPDADDLQGTTT